MARKSKYKNTTSTKYVKNYIAGVYTRLSKERTEEWRNKSSSIDNQKTMCINYASDHDVDIYKIYSDYEYTGTNFSRPGYIEMMSDLKSGVINCVVVRDLSRLGRDYLELGTLVEKVFPFIGARFISVEDGIDTMKNPIDEKSSEIALKNIVNELYSKDISVKVKSAKKAKVEAGYFVGSTAKYGYEIYKTKGGNKLKIDKNVEHIVKKIFDLFLEGHGVTNIAKMLNTSNFSSPALYNKTKEVYSSDSKFQWRSSYISSMLVSEVYIGNMVQGTKSQFLAMNEERKNISRDKRIVVENTHEAIISKKDFNEVQSNMKKYKPNVNKYSLDNKYKGIVFDKNTGITLYRQVRENQNCTRFINSYTHNSGMIVSTPRISIKESDLDLIVLNCLRQEFKFNNTYNELKVKMKSMIISANKTLNDRILRLNNKIASNEKKSMDLYELYVEKQISKEEYINKKTKLQSSLDMLIEDMKESIIKKENVENQLNSNLDYINHLLNIKDRNVKLSRGLISKLIDKIEISNNEEISIKWKFDMKSVEENNSNV